MRSFAIMLAALAFGYGLECGPAGAQQTPSQVPQAAQPITSENALRDKKNANTIGIATGQLDAAYPRLAQDISKILDDGDNLRILPILTQGSLTNIEDLLWLRGVDVGFTKSDAFEYYRSVKKVNNLQNRIRYIARLFGAELHVLAPTNVASVKDLQGKKIAIGIGGSASQVTMPIILERLGVQADLLTVDQVIGIEMMKKGEIDAVARVASKPVDTFAKIPANSGFHLVSLPSLDLFSDLYTIGEFTSKDYPTLIAAGQTVDTISVSEVLAVYNWPKDSERYRRVEKFIQAFFAKFEQLQQTPFHPKWKEVNLAARLDGWTRFEASERILQRMNASSSEPLRQDFDTFLKSQNRRGAVDQAERDALFKDFMTWRNGKQTQ